MLKDKETWGFTEKEGGSFRDDEIYRANVCRASIGDEDIAGFIMSNINY